MPLKLGKFCARHPPKVVLGVLPGPFNMIGFYLHFLPLILIDLHFLERVLVKYGEMVVPKLVQGTIGTPTITVYGGLCFYMHLMLGIRMSSDLSETGYMRIVLVSRSTITKI